jgi:cell division protein FtsW
VVQKMGKRTVADQNNQQTAQTRRVFVTDVSQVAFTRPAKEEKPAIRFRPLHLRFDLPILLTVAILVIFGLLMLYSASYDYSLIWAGDPYAMISRQILWLGLGIIGMVFFALFDYHYFRILAFPALIFTTGLLALVLALNEVTNNAVRSLWEGSVRPSELAKIIIIIYVAVWLYARQERLTKLSIGLVPLSIVLGGVGGLILRQPDLSAVVTIFILGGVIFFLAGGDLRQLGMLMVGALGVGFLIVRVSATANQRISDYILGWQDPQLVSDHVRGALESFINGGWIGTGPGKGVAKILHLPVAPTDSIFAVVGEEFGVVGAAFVLGLFVFLMWRGLIISRKAPDQLGALLIAGLCIWLAFEAFVNMAVVLNVLPFAGNALPFFSSGGSSLVTSLAAIGIILNVARQSVDKESERENSATVDMRRGNRRRSVSRPDNLAGIRK